MKTRPPSGTPPWHRPTLSTVQDVIASDGVISLSTNTTFLNQTAPKDQNDLTVAYEATIPDGNYIDQRKMIQIQGDAVENTALWRVFGNFVGFVTALLDKDGQSLELVWDGKGWHKIGGNATAEDQ